MQNAFKHQVNTLKTRMQQVNMKLHAKLSKFHIEHAQNGAMVQHMHSKQDITTICPKQQSVKAYCKHHENMLQHPNMKTKGIDVMYR